MQRLVVGVALALASSPASAQVPAASLWQNARAALAFGHAEGELAALRRFAITSAPQTRQAADAALDKLDRRAQAARDAYAFVARFGSPFWTAAADIRIGDTFRCQAEKISTIPIPPQLTAAAQRLPPNVLAQYREVLHGLARPLEEQAARSWERAVANEDASPFVAARARERLAGTTAPDC